MGKREEELAAHNSGENDHPDDFTTNSDPN